jgi:hypothetical protein
MREMSIYSTLAKRLSLLLCCVSCFGACARKSEAVKEASAGVISSEDEICNLLTADEVAAEMKQPVTARTKPKTGTYSAPTCAWLTGDAPDSAGYTLTLFFHPDSPDGPENFKEKIKHVCDVPEPMNKPPPPTKPIEGLGDEAALCRKLLVRKGNVFFFMDRQKGDPAVPWQEGAQRLASKAVSRLP